MTDLSSGAWSGNKAIATLFQYAVRLEQSGKPEMADAIFRHLGTFSGAEFRWSYIQTHITSLLDKSIPPSLNRVIILTLPYIGRDVYALDPTTVVSKWIAAASAVPYSEVDQNMTQALLMVSCNDDMRPHIPVNVWAWLNKRPFLPPTSRGRSEASRFFVVRHIRKLGDIEILKSYFFLVWSEWESQDNDCLTEMERSIREDFGGILMQGHRGDLIRRLDFIHEELGQNLTHFRRYQRRMNEDDLQHRKEQYRRLKDALLVVDKIAMETSTREPPRLIFLG